VRSSSQGEQLQSLLGELGVGQRPRAPDPGDDLGAVAFGEQVAHVPLVVAMAAVHQRVFAEHVLDRSA
jgi:hypothetical protein